MSGYAFNFQGAAYTPEGRTEVSDMDAHNRALAEAEVAAWLAEPPMRYFGYVQWPQGVKPWTRVECSFTTWTGHELGTICAGPRVYGNFGGYRRPVTVYGLNGRSYHGWYYESSGDYARIKMHKRHARTGAAQW